MKKEIYTAPEMEIAEFEVDDIITWSGTPGIDEGEADLGGLL